MSGAADNDRIERLGLPASIQSFFVMIIKWTGTVPQAGGRVKINFVNVGGAARLSLTTHFEKEVDWFEKANDRKPGYCPGSL